MGEEAIVERSGAISQVGDGDGEEFGGVAGGGVLVRVD